MKPELIATIISCVIACGGVLIYIGRSLGTLHSIGEGVKVALQKTDQHEKDIATLKVDLVAVKTRQEDCERCP